MAVVSEAVKILQNTVGTKADGIFGPNTLKAAAKYYNLNRNQAAHFFGQINHETNGFTAFTENLNYSAKGLQQTFPRYFTEESAKIFEYSPKNTANLVYANRMGNYGFNSGDGWAFRGRGAIQLTGRANYRDFSDSINEPDILINPDTVATTYAFSSAYWFFTKNGLWELASRGVDDETIYQVTKKINGGTNGLAVRKEKTLNYYKVLG